MTPGEVGAVPRVSVLLPTYNRARYLAGALRGFVEQSTPKADFELIVIDDGSTDNTKAICEQFESELELRYLSISHGGLAAAKNRGLAAARAKVLLFADDDDFPCPDLVAAHLRIHDAYPDDSTAVLGYTTWAPTLEITPVMEYVTEIGQLLFAYRDIVDQQVLPYHYFWGGRSSCKTAFLVEHGMFETSFGRILEDVELGYRLSQFGMQVIFGRQAVSYMCRALTFVEFCRRCEARGRALARFCELHSTPEVEQYTDIEAARARWAVERQMLSARVRAVLKAERTLQHYPDGPPEWLRDELHDHYAWVFTAYQDRGVASAHAAHNPAASADPR